MSEASLPRDSLFQLNVLIWATFPQPLNAPWNPVLLNAGYELWSVELPLEAGLAELAALSASNPAIGPNPVADVVLQRQGSDRYVLVECKATSFGAASEHAPQARGLIVAGANVATRLGLAPGSTAEVCYLVPAEDAASMDTGLIEIATEVSEQGSRSVTLAPSDCR